MYVVYYFELFYECFLFYDKWIKRWYSETEVYQGTKTAFYIKLFQILNIFIVNTYICNLYTYFGPNDSINHNIYVCVWTKWIIEELPLLKMFLT